VPRRFANLASVLALLSCARSPAPVSEAEHSAAPSSAPAKDPSALRAQQDRAAEPPGVGAAGPASALVPAAVVELFTSEGCSSCPPADQNLAAIAAEAERAGRRIYTLELHVDYWNQLGWVDPFSSAQFSARQRAYASRLGVSGVYTPEMVVNGREELIGSRAAAARAAIERAFARPAEASVRVSASKADQAMRVDYRVASQRSVRLALAVAEDTAVTEVTRGENASRTLRHRHVVRAFTTRDLAATASGTWLASWPVAADRAAFVVAFVSDPESLGVLGADAVTVP
jgi:hypothetical protein